MRITELENKSESVWVKVFANKTAHFVAIKKIQVGKDQEKAQSEKDSHSKNRGGKNQTNNQVLITKNQTNNQVLRYQA